MEYLEQLRRTQIVGKFPGHGIYMRPFKEVSSYEHQEKHIPEGYYQELMLIWGSHFEVTDAGYPKSQSYQVQRQEYTLEKGFLRGYHKVYSLVERTAWIEDYSYLNVKILSALDGSQRLYLGSTSLWDQEYLQSINILHSSFSTSFPSQLAHAFLQAPHHVGEGVYPTAEETRQRELHRDRNNDGLGAPGGPGGM